MGVFKFLIPIWAAIAIYSLFSFFNGPKGISAFNQLKFEHEQQINNLEKLGYINDELEKIKNNLLFDYDTQLVYARQIGYAHEDERFIRIVGLGNLKNMPAITGEVYFAKEPDFIPDKSLKIAVFCIGLFIFAFLFVLELIETRVR
jgi:cell division protein FtsB